MSIEFRCSNCSKLLRTADNTAGRQAQCPDCGALTTIPGKADASDAGAPPPITPSDRPFATGGSQPSGRGPIVAPPELDVADVLGRTWRLFVDRMGLCIVAALLPTVIIATLSFALRIFVAVIQGVTRSQTLTTLFSSVVAIAVAVVSACLMVSLIRVFLKIARGLEASLGEVFTFDAATLAAVLTSIVFGLMVSVGTVLCIIPGVYLMVLFYPCVTLAIDRHLMVGDALSTARRMTEGNRMNLFLIWLLSSVGAGVVNVLTCGVGAFFTTPFLLLLNVVIYLALANEPIGRVAR
ncbi:MAG: hypothetical protein LLG00_05885 [Planctomycetaceae bacterium]|nr:hypothetical protein [Planctomycetaceae bacterium]